MYDRLIRPIFTIKDSPHSIALGTAVGIWIALTPTVGIQMTLSLIACTLLRANILVAVAMCWLTNPVTFIPWYYFCYRTGLVLTQEDPMTWKEFKTMIKNDYVIIGPGTVEQPKNPATTGTEPTEEELKQMMVKKILAEIDKNPSLKLLHSAEDQELVTKVKQWCEANKIKVEWEESKEGLEKILAKSLESSRYGIVDQKEYQTHQKKYQQYLEDLKEIETLSKELEETKDAKKRKNIQDKLEKLKSEAKEVKNLPILCEISAERDGWSQFVEVLLLGLTSIALPLWIGGLFWATVLGIPAYPVTYRAIVRFRNKVSNMKEKYTQKHTKQEELNAVQESSKIPENTEKKKTEP